jgi:hypothetical protein
MRTAAITLTLLMLASSAVAQRDKSQRPSQPAEVELALNNKKITIAYSRPRIRDPKTGQPRKIMGGVVPYGEPWRTGANEATTFVTEGDLKIGGTPVPKGSYTLYTIPNENSWTLIISKKTGQWGIPYPGAKDDLARIPMKVEPLSQTVDPFTITLERAGAAARLCFAWENTKACVNVEAP